MKTRITLLLAAVSLLLAGCISYHRESSHYDPITGKWVVDKSVGTPW